MPVELEDVYDDVFALFSQYITSDDLLSELAEPVAAMLRDAVTGLTDQQVIDAARAVLGPHVTEVTESTIKGIAESVADALENQLGVQGAKNAIREKIGLRSDQVERLKKLEAEGYTPEQLAKERERMLDDRAELIARDQMNTAMSAGEHELMKEAGARWKRWSDTGDGKVSDGCKANSAAGWIPIDEPYPSGHQHPTRQPRCRCGQQFRTTLPSEAA
jgi:hypothetical protein